MPVLPARPVVNGYDGFAGQRANRLNRLHLEIIHQAKHVTDIYVNRTLLHAAAATHTRDAAFVFVHEVLELVHKTLSDPLQFLAARVMTRSMQRKERKHTCIPIAQPNTIVLSNLILDIEAPASGADECAYSAIDTSELNIFPEVSVKQVCYPVPP